MAGEEGKCRLCGEPLVGRDHLEGVCRACREAEILGAPGATTRAEGAVAPRRSAPRVAALALAVCVVVVGAAAGLRALQSRSRSADPTPRDDRPETAQALAPADVAEDTDVEAPPAPAAAVPIAASPQQALRVRTETRELLSLVQRGQLGRVIDNYAQPDAEAFQRAQAALNDVLAGAASRGFAQWSARIIRLGQRRAAEQLLRAGDTDPDYTVALLAHLARDPSASGMHLSGEERARGILRWHIAGLFDGLDLTTAQVVEVMQVGPQRFAARLECSGRRHAAWLRGEPRRVVWCKLPVGWVIKVSLPERLERARDTLARAVPGSRSEAP